MERNPVLCKTDKGCNRGCDKTEQAGKRGHRLWDQEDQEGTLSSEKPQYMLQ